MKSRNVLIAIGVLVGFAQLTFAGPPLVCFPFETNGQPSLPWAGTGWHESSPTYNTANLAGDTLNLLGNDVSVLARMETLRRAGIYAAKEPKAGAELLTALRTRIKNSRDQKSLAYGFFDLGYFAETYRQASIANRKPEPHQMDGYSLVAKALRDLPKDDPEMHFAAALMTLEPKYKKDHEHHLEEAARGAQEGSLLARNLVSHFQWRGKDLQSLRASIK